MTKHMVVETFPFPHIWAPINGAPGVYILVPVKLIEESNQ